MDHEPVNVTEPVAPVAPVAQGDQRDQRSRDKGPIPRVLHLMLARTPGGGDRFFEKLTGALAHAGVPQALVIEPNAERERLLASHPHARVEPIRFSGWRDWFARRKLRRVVDGFAPDVALAWMSRAARRLPMNTPRRIARLGDFYPLKHYRRCDHLIANTPGILTYMRDAGWSEHRTHLIPNFCDPPPVDVERDALRAQVRREMRVSDDATLVVALGRLHRKKAHDVLFKALAPLERHHLLLAGDGPLRDELRALAAKLGIAERVHMLGWRRDAERLLNAADVCVLPSRFEPLGNVILEAWAGRVPVIAARSEGPEWLIEHERTGLLFPIDDADALTGHLRLLDGDPARGARLAEAGHAQLERRFSREAIVEEYLRLLRAVTANGGDDGATA